MVWCSVIKCGMMKYGMMVSVRCTGAALCRSTVLLQPPYVLRMVWCSVMKCGAVWWNVA